MPITAKFSRDFCDKFGHEAVDELVDFLNRIDSGYRWELHELNERNFARFDDRLERRLAEVQARLEARIDQRVAGLEVRLNRRIEELDTKVEQRTAELRADLKSGLATVQSHLIRWMFLLVATGVLTILGLG